MVPDCATCKHLNGTQCRRKAPMRNSRTGEQFWPFARGERSDAVRYHSIGEHCGQQGRFYVRI